MNIRDHKNQIMTDHVSIADPESIKQLAILEKGDLIKFAALVYRYTKGYKGEEIEIRQQHPIENDYGLWDVRDVLKLNLSPRIRTRLISPSLDTLKKDKRIALGVCI